MPTLSNAPKGESCPDANLIVTNNNVVAVIVTVSGATSDGKIEIGLPFINTD